MDADDLHRQADKTCSRHESTHFGDVMFIRHILLISLLGLVSCATNYDDAPPIHRKMLLLVERFDQYDGDGNGMMSRAEMEKAVNAMGPKPLTKEQCDRAMVIYDTNRDKQISRTEAKTAAEHGPVLFEN